MRNIPGVIVLLTLSLAVSIAPASAQVPGTNGKIAFMSSRNGNSDIYSIEGDGSNETRLTSDPAEDYTPTFSPLATKIAFVSGRSGSDEIYEMSADGSNVTRLTTGSQFSNGLAYSPDGSKIAYGGRAGIYVMNSDGSSNVRVQAGPGLGYPSFSPDGRKIVYQVAATRVTAEIRLMNADGTRDVQLTNSPGEDLMPSFSPDGSKIVFSSERDTDGDSPQLQIYVMNPDGSSPTRLTNNVGSDNYSSFSPDGRKITFTSSQNNQTQVYTMDADGSNPVPLTAGNNVNMRSSWGVGPSARPTIWNMMVEDGQTIPDLGEATAAVGDGLHIVTLDGGQPNSFVGTRSVWFIKGSPAGPVNSCTAASSCVAAPDFRTAWDGSSVNAFLPSALVAGDRARVQVNTDHGSSDPGDVAATVKIVPGPPTCPFLDRSCTP